MTGNARAAAFFREPEDGANPAKARAGESPPSGMPKGVWPSKHLPGSARYRGGACQRAMEESAFQALIWVVPRSFVP